MPTTTYNRSYNPYLTHRNHQGRSWTGQGENVVTRANGNRAHLKFNKFWEHDISLSTLNVRSLGAERQDSDFYFSYLESLGHDATGVTEM